MNHKWNYNKKNSKSNKTKKLVSNSTAQMGNHTWFFGHQNKNHHSRTSKTNNTKSGSKWKQMKNKGHKKAHNTTAKLNNTKKGNKTKSHKCT